MSSWLEWFPERLDEELNSYHRNSIDVEIDQTLRARGIFSLLANIEIDEVTYELRIDYPSLFPYFQPMAFLLSQKLARHQSPHGGHLCLLGRGTSQWNSDDKFGDILAERFPIILQINQESDREKISKLEEPQGEPYTEYLNSLGVDGSALIYKDTWELPQDAQMGMASIDYATVASGKKSAAPLVGIIQKVMKKQEVLASWDGPNFEQFQRTIKLPWLRLKKPPEQIDQSFFDHLDDHQRNHIGLNKLSRQESKSFLLIFPEEAEQFQYRDGIACVTMHPRISAGRNLKTVSHQIFFQRTFRSGIEELNARMPGISELAQKTVTLFGLGALGSFAALELARAGVGQLRLVDFDYVEPATVRRWAIGASAFGKQKTEALEEHIATEYPWTKVQSFSQMRIGDVHKPRETKDQFVEIVDALADADLVIDLTAESGVNELLSMISAKVPVPYLCGSATPGAWGGYIAYFRQHNKEACWVCMTHDLYGEVWAEDLPPSDPSGTFQPPGCPSTTFTGTSVDLQEISLEAVRQAFGMLTQEYPLPSGQLSILRHRDEKGARLLPSWKSREIVRRKECACN